MVSERSGERVGPAAEQKPVTQELLDEARRYETLARITGWPIVSNTAQSAVDTYSTLKKRNEVARVTLGLSELVLITYCQLILLPIVRLPFVRTPLKVADHFSSKGVRLIEQAAPRLKERERPLRVNGELLLTAVFLPLTICIALARGAMEGVANRLVIAFPPLKEAARGFGQKNVLGQWITLLLMVYLYLPLQFVSHPGETLQQILAIPSKIAWAVTGLESYLRDLLAALVAYLKKQEGTVAQLANSLAQTAPVQWMVRQMWMFSPTRIWAWFSSSEVSGRGRTSSPANGVVPAASSSRRPAGLLARWRPPAPSDPSDLWEPWHIVTALLVTIGTVSLAVVLVTLH